MAIDLGDEVEEPVGVREIPGASSLEGDTSLGVEANPGARSPHGLRGVDAAHACRRELASEEQRRLAVATADDQGALGGRDVEKGRGERRQRWRAHRQMIAIAAGEAIL